MPLSPSAPGLRRPRPLLAAAGVLGELLITLGVLLALFVVYSLWWTDVVADQRADGDAARVRQSWSAPPAAAGPGAGADARPRPGSTGPGTGWASCTSPGWGRTTRS